MGSKWTKILHTVTNSVNAVHLIFDTFQFGFADEIFFFKGWGV